MNGLVKDLFGLVFQAVGFVNTFWAVYATVTIAMVGWIFASKSNWPSRKKFALSAAYAIVVSLNGAAHFRMNVILNALIGELQTAIRQTETFSVAARDVMAAVAPLPPSVLLAIHIVIDLGVISLIWMQGRFSEAGANDHPATER